ncbi:HtaA domain-containing protein [Streptomyces sp. GESEQ-35]|uniref:HtaA domain-containing protein n=1 Tax=Streptomyces sp. GESEQ-35 TaxID=2812657 RepID=UPI001B323B37|nr:HtaA domain-containing protein [Streptomyces sp. GESEQ-35]
MLKRPGAAVLAGGALLALLGPAGPADAEETFPREVSGGYATWATGSAELDGVTLTAVRPAVQGSAGRTSFPATGGGADPESGAADIDLGGTLRLDGSAGQPLVLGTLRLSLEGDDGALHARTAVGGRARDLTLAEVATDGAALAVRAGGVTWTGLQASLTEEGAELLAAWSGAEFAAGDGLGVLDVTVGTGSGTPVETPEPTPTAESPGAEPGTEQPKSQRPTGTSAKPTATVTHPNLTAGSEQTVTGTGFEPGAVVLVAIDGDTRHQAVADDRGRVERAFPVYATAEAGAHAVELYSPTGEQPGVSAQFAVESSDFASR